MHWQAYNKLRGEDNRLRAELAKLYAAFTRACAMYDGLLVKHNELVADNRKTEILVQKVRSLHCPGPDTCTKTLIVALQTLHMLPLQTCAVCHEVDTPQACSLPCLRHALPLANLGC